MSNERLAKKDENDTIGTMINNRSSFFFLLLLTTTLIAAHFGFVWAGGSGYKLLYSSHIQEITGTVRIDHAGTEYLGKQNDVLRRGEIIQTEDGSRLFFEIGSDVRVALDERSILVLNRLSQNDISLHLTAGRIFIFTSKTHPVTLTTLHTKETILEGALSIVNYDFQQTVSVIPFKTATEVTVRKNKSFLTSTAVNIRETDPSEITESAFNADAPSVAAFYDWAFEKTGFRNFEIF
ncbi:MAG: hypothetical protein UU48_C0015G0013 [Candidatus Uhrbacteria bacterium GW2011_GWF2_41_16]|uniref:FecR protein domain-containing protein n=2 Tax=Candidatus Uhriibacteriota TaxID=1752732 RepID=A0A0G0YAV7_9BACT|nr:MAG: hypothetical protein UU35_C0016G0013 [Candidatus Uhrbacteria bacterium GW2011_GWC2_41_11]KKR97437.1 MAG: hypothetical protein UU48_C0015G0013 [Candidatus Uhrbacteria bacterium GW2011_GWF2_41_16]